MMIMGFIINQLVYSVGQEKPWLLVCSILYYSLLDGF
jgi:Na+/melibiose symporter-like transporter